MTPFVIITHPPPSPSPSLHSSIIPSTINMHTPHHSIHHHHHHHHHLHHCHHHGPSWPCHAVLMWVMEVTMPSSPPPHSPLTLVRLIKRGACIIQCHCMSCTWLWHQEFPFLSDFKPLFNGCWKFATWRNGYRQLREQLPGFSAVDLLNELACKSGFLFYVNE